MYIYLSNRNNGIIFYMGENSSQCTVYGSLREVHTRTLSRKKVVSSLGALWKIYLIVK